MRIAYISYEHPLGIGGGGIGTYTDQIASVMAARGHTVEVFSTNGIQKTTTLTVKGYQLHLLSYAEATAFKKSVLPLFSERHAAVKFEIIESPEYGADGLLIKKKYPEIPLILKLHTPTFLVSRLNDEHTLFKKLRFIIGGLIKGQFSKPYWTYNKIDDLEYEQYLLADGIYSPSSSLKAIVSKEWGNKNIDVVPNPFVPQPGLLALQSNENPTLRVTFLGRLEKRKGILDLIKAIPLVLHTHQVKFYLVGQALDSPIRGKKMDQYIKEELKNYENQIVIQDQVKYQEIETLFSDTDICVFPSIWENFPTVCLEAMAAGKVVIGTNSGGMKEMIIDGVTGILIPPNSPTKIASAITSLADHRNQIAEMGKNAREQLLTSFNSDTIGNLTEIFYRKINPHAS